MFLTLHFSRFSNKQKLLRAIWALNVIFLRDLTICFANGTYYDIMVVSKSAGPAGQSGVDLEGKICEKIENITLKRLKIYSLQSENSLITVWDFTRISDFLLSTTNYSMHACKYWLLSESLLITICINKLITNLFFFSILRQK